ncbi:hypothetical protein CPB83DRAFT_844379 [Crepidotus variabilis]|uniref:Probable RNA polymerase II nuclear localization protein SLC7A6OS n=1 Tax=Crepidotus variabilis TaxID=179855 RepID=A0A9P6JUP3_9AGAR|nr:hypothetical protein CPB83DRAFT_844379 [Crepidotus variabilis]
MQSSLLNAAGTSLGADIPSMTPSTSQPYTILRIKRKRNEEPLDALVVESARRKKSRGLGVFQYAETVEADAWDDAARQRDIQEKISKLAQHLNQTQVKREGPPSPTKGRTKEELSRRYTIVDNDDEERPNEKPLTAPPKVLSSKEVEERRLAKEQAAKDFKMYDAIPTGQRPIVQEDTSEMDKFLPMLNDYLRIHDINPAADIPADGSKRLDVNGNDYVWDVFYHRPATLSEWNAAANVGTLTGLPANFEGYDSLSDSDDEFLDEADEDSNAEEYYKNDYPEEEDNSDEFHEDSDDFGGDDDGDDDF